MSRNQPKPANASRMDLHCHSTASEVSKLGVQRALGLPECATPPEEVYALAKARGMDFVTITDHDTIEGAVELADKYDDAFISEELTAWFRGEPQAVHILCWGITREDHDQLQSLAKDVEAVAEYLSEHEITCALAHPFYAVEAPLLPRHRRRLAHLFPVWEVRNGARSPELNAPAKIYIDTHGGTGVAGTDDHAGIDIGRTWTQTPKAETWQEFLGQIRKGNTTIGGSQGSTAKWAHAAMALAVRSLGKGENVEAPQPLAVLSIVERVLSEGDKRRGENGNDLGPEDARALLGAWLQTVGLEMSERELLDYLQREDVTHGSVMRLARGAHERRLAQATWRAVETAATGGDYTATLLEAYEACLPAIPYIASSTFIGSEKKKLVSREGEPLRVALIADAISGTDGVTHTLEQIRRRGVPDFEVEVIGTDASVDRRLSAVAEVEIPFYAGLNIGVPSLFSLGEALSEGQFDLIHLCSPGPSGIAAAILGKVMRLPVLASYHTDLVSYAEVRAADDARVAGGMKMVLQGFYGNAHHVVTPSPQSDEVMQTLGIPAERMSRWDRGVDLKRFSPSRRRDDLLPGEKSVLYAGRLTNEKGVQLLADAFLAAHAKDPSLHLCLAGGGPEEESLREKLGDKATFLGWLRGDVLAEAYASADAFLFASRTDTFGQVLLEAQASGLPVVAVAENGPLSIVEDGVSGLLREADAGALAEALVSVTSNPELAARLREGGIASTAERSWDASLGRLADGYRAAIAEHLSRGGAGESDEPIDVLTADDIVDEDTIATTYPEPRVA
ncbi:MAG: glycosyltransferase [Solirubrobacteraceae bacterium]|nr:glycosyltransferase [Solirubrobacteraceae bacterium]